MRKILFLLVFALCLVAVFAGCRKRKIDGPRFWWDDRAQVKLEEYRLPRDPAAPDEYGRERRRALASGDDLSDDDLRDYNTNIDQLEEKRKSESSLVNF